MKNVARPSLSIFAASRDHQIVSQHRKTKLEGEYDVFLLVTQAYSDKVKKNPSAPNRSRTLKGVVVDIYFNSIIPVSVFRM